ncbi:hypothetical protein ACPA9J_19160 [Pseudomonas aeruginosa]
MFWKRLDSPLMRPGGGLPVCRPCRISCATATYQAKPGRRPGDGVHRPAGHLGHHWTKALLASPTGLKLYVGVGSNSNITENGAAIGVPSRAADSRVDVASRSVICTSAPQPTDCSGNRSQQAVDHRQRHDEIGNDLVPDYLTSVREGGFCGWPTATSASTWIRPGEAAASDLVARPSSPTTRWVPAWLRWACSF